MSPGYNSPEFNAIAAAQLVAGVVHGALRSSFGPRSHCPSTLDQAKAGSSPLLLAAAFARRARIRWARIHMSVPNASCGASAEISFWHAAPQTSRFGSGA